MTGDDGEFFGEFLYFVHGLLDSLANNLPSGATSFQKLLVTPAGGLFQGEGLGSLRRAKIGEVFRNLLELL